MQNTSFKRGDSWSYTATVEFKDANGNAINISNVTISSELKTKGGKLVQRFSVDWVSLSNGTFYHKASSGETANWPVDELVFDIVFRFNSTGDVISSNPVYVKVV
jgi:hypothetical protein